MAALLFTNGCATTLGNKSDINKVRFEVGKTSKRDVAQTLGFPAMRVVDQGTEWWGYKKGSVFDSLYWGDFFSTSILAQHTFDAQYASAAYINQNMDSMRSKSAVIYGFGQNGVLTDTIRPSSKSSR
jgi:hypothetical protein